MRIYERVLLVVRTWFKVRWTKQCLRCLRKVFSSFLDHFHFSGRLWSKKIYYFFSQTSEYSEPYRSINFQKMTFSSFSWSVDKTVCPMTTKQVPIDSPGVLEPVRGWRNNFQRVSNGFLDWKLPLLTYSKKLFWEPSGWIGVSIFKKWRFHYFPGL